MRKMITITPVGTSLFSNYMKEYDDITSYYEMFENKMAGEWNRYTAYTDAVRDEVIDWAMREENASAEITSLLRRKEKHPDEELDVYLIATDSVVSQLAATIIKERFDNMEYSGITVNFERSYDCDVIRGLQVESEKRFQEEGLRNLENRIDQIASGNYSNIIFNITGCHKALIPYLTIWGQCKKCPLFFTFENVSNSNELIEINTTF